MKYDVEDERWCDGYNVAWLVRQTTAWDVWRPLIPTSPLSPDKLAFVVKISRIAEPSEPIGGLCCL